MKTAKEILCEVFEASSDDLQLNITLNPSVSLIEQAMEAYHEEKTRWMKCSERLPETTLVYTEFNSSVGVLCLMKNGTIEIAKYQISGINKWSGWYNEIMDDATDTPTHWRELPTPPTN